MKKHERRSVLKVTAVAMGAFLVLAALSPWLLELVPAAFGLACYGVHGGSMEPFLSDGDLVYAEAVPAESLEAGDVAVFRDWADPEGYVVHRVLENFPEKHMLATQGDANGAPDALPVPYGNICGRMACRVPGMGRVLDAATAGPGACATVFFAAAGAMLLAMAWAAPCSKSKESCRSM